MVYKHLNLNKLKKTGSICILIDIMLYIIFGNHDLYDYISFFILIIMICISFYVNCILFNMFGP